jgi:hypothetical protein
LMRWRVGAGGLGPCRARSCVEVVERGTGLVKLRGGVLLLEQFLLLLPFPSWCGAGGRENAGAVRVS